MGQMQRINFPTGINKVLLLLLLLSETLMANYITDLDVSQNRDEERYLLRRGFKKIDVDLNKGAGGDYIYIWYKQQSGASPITGLQVTFNHDMGVGLSRAGFTKINKDLNAGAGGDYIYLWYFRGQTEYNIPIVDIDVTTRVEDEGRMFDSGWERLACDLNRNAGGNWIQAWVKRERQTYICDVTATDSYGSDSYLLQNGYIRVDEDANRSAGGADVFIWYRQTTDSKLALDDLQISLNDDEYHFFQHHNYKSVNVDLNHRAGGNYVYMWYKKEEFKNPIKAITVIVNQDAVSPYLHSGVKVIKKDLNANAGGHYIYLCFYQ